MKILERKTKVYVISQCSFPDKKTEDKCLYQNKTSLSANFMSIYMEYLKLLQI